MLGFLSHISALGGLFGGDGSAVGVDLGTETLRLAQVHPDPDRPRLVAAASRDVPPELVNDPVGYAEFCGRSLREMWREGKFAGRHAVLGVPSSMMHLLHLRLPKVEAGQVEQMLAFESAGKLPFDPMMAMLRHHVVGDVYNNDGPRQETICTAVRRDYVDLLLNAAEKARLEVAGLVATPVALRDCFSRLYRRTVDAETAFCFVDIGRAATRVMIMRAGHLYFARSIEIGAEHLNQAVGRAVGVQPMEAKLLRAQLTEQQAQADLAHAESQRAAVQGDAEATETEHEFALLGAALKAGRSGEPTATAPQAAAVAHAAPGRYAAVSARYGTAPDRSSLVTEMSVAQAIEPVVHALADELQRCRRYHEATFPGVPVDRLVFVGGEAHSRPLCQALARRLGIAAQLGDPIATLCQDDPTQVDVPDFMSAGIDRRRPQPGWAVACGLSLGAA